MDTLTIPAIPVYNEIRVTCVATFVDGSPSEVTPPVMFRILVTAAGSFLLQA